MCWKGDNFAYTWNLFKNDFLKRFQGINEDKFFSKLTRLQQKGNVEEFTHQWESLTTRLFGLTNKQQLETYVGGLKPYIQNELKMHDIANVEAARRKEKVVEAKFNNFQT